MEVHMNNLYTAVTKKDGNWWIGWVLESLRITLKEALEFNMRLEIF
jgi:hypothetical protein